MPARRAEIVGAGFAGLSAACALAQRGWRVRVHERADGLRTTGAGIYIYENGLRVLERLGAFEEAVAGAPFAHTREVSASLGLPTTWPAPLRRLFFRLAGRSKWIVRQRTRTAHRRPTGTTD